MQWFLDAKRVAAVWEWVRGRGGAARSIAVARADSTGTLFSDVGGLFDLVASSRGPFVFRAYQIVFLCVAGTRTVARLQATAIESV